jgi:hypothetical protein
MFGSTFSPCANLGYNAPGAYPINFLKLNPYSAGAIPYVDDTGWNSYNGLQIQLRKQFSHGLTWQTNYTFSKGLTNNPADNATSSNDWTTLRNQSLDRQPSPFDIRQVFQTFGTYDLPLGKGRGFAISNRILDAVIGGWTVGSVFVVSSGQPYRLTSGYNTVNGNDSGVILANGVTLSEIQSRMTTSQGPSTNRYSLNTALIGADGRANPQYLLPPTTPGQFGQFLYLYGKNAFSWNGSLNKAFSITERMKLTLWAGATNVLNHPTWGLASGTNNYANIGANNTPNLNTQSTVFGQVTNGPNNGSRSIQFRGTFTF